MVNLAYYNKLRLPLLRGLARLLKLLASWFNVTLGQLSLFGLRQAHPSWCAQCRDAREAQMYAPQGHVAAGEKLIDHLKKWLEPEKLLAVQHSWDPGQECQIAAAILDLFHLLPPPAVKFLETQASSLLETFWALIVSAAES